MIEKVNFNKNMLVNDKNFYYNNMVTKTFNPMENPFKKEKKVERIDKIKAQYLSSVETFANNK